MRRFFFDFEDLGASLNIGRATYRFKEIVMDVFQQPTKDSYCDDPHIALLGEERYGTHDVLGFIRFTNVKNLKLAEKGLKMLEKAIDDDMEETATARRKR